MTSSKKYKNTIYNVDGISFDSKKEAERYRYLKAKEKVGEITDLERQKVFKLIDDVHESNTIGPRGGIKKGKLIMRGVSYIADFVYKDSSGNIIVEDVKPKGKGFRATQAYYVFSIKKKLMYHEYGILVKEI